MLVTLVERFWSKVDTSGDGCWLWRGAVDRHGYGQFTVRRGDVQRAHRVAWKLAYGHSRLPEGKQVAHRCDVPGCVRPSHLFLASNAENLADMSAKGRSTRGERSPSAKLTESDVREIHRLFLTGECRVQRELGRRFGVSGRAVGLILAGKNWSHVHPSTRGER